MRFFMTRCYLFCTQLHASKAHKYFHPFKPFWCVLRLCQRYLSQIQGQISYLLHTDVWLLLMAWRTHKFPIDLLHFMVELWTFPFHFDSLMCILDLSLSISDSSTFIHYKDTQHLKLNKTLLTADLEVILTGFLCFCNDIVLIYS